jgi:hypothetical protein
MCGKRPAGGLSGSPFDEYGRTCPKLAATSENPARTSRCCAPGDAACPRTIRRRYVCSWHLSDTPAAAENVRCPWKIGSHRDRVQPSRLTQSDLSRTARFPLFHLRPCVQGLSFRCQYRARASFDPSHSLKGHSMNGDLPTTSQCRASTPAAPRPRRKRSAAMTLVPVARERNTKNAAGSTNRSRGAHRRVTLEDRCVGNQPTPVIKLASGSTCTARFIRGTEHGDARFATAALSDQHADALQKTSGYCVAHSSRCSPDQNA